MKILPSAQSVRDQFADAPRWYRSLIRFRFILAGIYLLALLLIVGWFGVATLSNMETPAFFVVCGVAVVFFILQAMLLAGAPQIHGRRPVRRRNKFISLFAGAAVAAVLTYAFILTTTSLCNHRPAELEFAIGDGPNPFIVLIAIPWLFWFLVFMFLWLSRWTQGFGEMYKLLIAGTAAELLFTVPVDVLVRRRTGCYCEEGTFWAFIVGGTTALWTFGPAIALLFLAVRLKHRQPGPPICLQCGYDLRGLPEPRCPECGTAFDPATGEGIHESSRSNTNLHE